MCKIVALSNYGPDSANPFGSIYRLTKNYKPLDVSKVKPALPHRIGFEVSDEARCILRTNGGWKDIQGKEFSLEKILTLVSHRFQCCLLQCVV